MSNESRTFALVVLIENDVHDVHIIDWQTFRNLSAIRKAVRERSPLFGISLRMQCVEVALPMVPDAPKTVQELVSCIVSELGSGAWY